MYPPRKPGGGRGADPGLCETFPGMRDVYPPCWRYFYASFCIFFADGYFCVGACSQGISELKDKEDISSVCMFNALEMELYIHGFGRAFYNCQTMRMSVLLSISYLLV